MMRYCKIRLADGAILSGPAPVPEELAGWPDSLLADVDAAVDPCPQQWRGLGYWPVVTVPTEYDDATQRLSAEVDLTVDAAGRRVLAAALAVNLTPDEVRERAHAKARADLATLDAVLPRATEDVVAVLTPEQRAALPSVLLDRLAAKQRARAVLAG